MSDGNNILCLSTCKRISLQAEIMPPSVQVLTLVMIRLICIGVDLGLLVSIFILLLSRRRAVTRAVSKREIQAVGKRETGGVDKRGKRAVNKRGTRAVGKRGRRASRTRRARVEYIWATRSEDSFV